MVAVAARSAGVRVGFEPVHALAARRGGVRQLARATRTPCSRAVAAPGDRRPLRHLPPLGRPGRAALDRRQRRPDRRRPRRATGRRPTAATACFRARASPAPRELVAALAAAGWDGALDVEIFSTPELFWGLPVAEAARRPRGRVDAAADRTSCGLDACRRASGRSRRSASCRRRGRGRERPVRPGSSRRGRGGDRRRTGRAASGGSERRRGCSRRTFAASSVPSRTWSTQATSRAGAA